MGDTRLPILQASAPQSSCLPQNAAAGSKVQECVLVIEDSEEAMWLVQDALQQYGNGKYCIEWAKDLSEGLLFLSKNNAAIVLLDLGLPDSTGPSSFASVRKIAPDVPILVLTGDSRPETEAEVTACGTQDYLIKDEVSGPLLVQAITAALYQAKRTHETKEAAVPAKS
jgi:DNA-binding response OmpR family regulator